MTRIVVCDEKRRVKRNPALAVHQVRKIVGVDFSAARDAGRHIWICSARMAATGLRVEFVKPAENLPGGGRERADATMALRRYLAGADHVVAGLDFPFSLPRAVVGQADYRAFLLQFGARFQSAEAFRASCFQAGQGREPKRMTDIVARAPFAPSNLRMFRQTFFGIRDVLAPLVESGSARVVPMMRPARGATTLIEICPAVFLKRARLYSPYKGSGSGPCSSREVVLDYFTERRSLLSLPPSVREIIIHDAGGDALDSVLAALATREALIEGRVAQAPPGDVRRIEGEIL